MDTAILQGDIKDAKAAKDKLSWVKETLQLTKDSLQSVLDQKQAVYDEELAKMDEVMRLRNLRLTEYIDTKALKVAIEVTIERTKAKLYD